jgi:hypothetical protein
MVTGYNSVKREREGAKEIGEKMGQRTGADESNGKGRNHSFATYSHPCRSPACHSVYAPVAWQSAFRF